MSIYIIFVFVSFVLCLYCFVFFFFKQKTAYEMRISDWSSDVCSSDLAAIIEREDGSYRGERLDDPRIEIIEVCAPMVEEDDRHACRRAELAIGEMRARGLHGAVRGRGPVDRKSTRLNSSH